jgi:hypothetical protein
MSRFGRALLRCLKLATLLAGRTAILVSDFVDLFI